MLYLFIAYVIALKPIKICTFTCSGNTDEINSPCEDAIVNCEKDDNACEYQTETPIFMQNLNTDSCVYISLQAPSIYIQNITIDTFYLNGIPKPLMQYQYFIELNSPIVQLQYFNASNYTLIAIGDLIIFENLIFQGLQLYIFTTASLMIQNSTFNATQTSCTNIFGFEKIDKTLANKTETTLKNLFNYNPIEITRDLITILVASNYTVVLYAGLDLTMSESIIYGSQVGLVGENINLTSTSMINTTGLGCQLNQGNARGPAFLISSQCRCNGNGGSNGGYGGVGLVVNSSISGCSDGECLLLTNSTRFMFELYPYGYLRDPMAQGSGGGILALAVSTSQGAGGGAVILNARQNLTLDGSIYADGVPSTISPPYSGAGSGGTIIIRYSNLFGIGSLQANGGASSNSQAGEGGGGMIKIRWYQTWANITSIKAVKGNFSGIVNFAKGARTESNASFLGQNGNIMEPWCPPFQQTTPQYGCQNCSAKKYKMWWGGQCILCPAQQTLSSYGDEDEDETRTTTTSISCAYLSNCKNRGCTCEKANQYLMIHSFIQIGVFTFLLIIGYLIRRRYKKRENQDEKNFDFETATRDIVAEKIIVDTIKDDPNFLLGDLMYHAYRIPVIGNNTYESPWVLHTEPPIEISHAVSLEDYQKFVNKFNKMVSWSNTQHYILNTLAIVYYPLLWWLQHKIKKKKFHAIQEFMSHIDNVIIISFQTNFWKQGKDQPSMRIKITKSADYTLLYLDIFNYKASDQKYIFLTCPFIILLSGEGNFLRPYYLCESDQFLVSIFFAINRNIDIHEDKKRILDNLVPKAKREENSKEFRRFLRKFNKLSMTIDYGAPAKVFIKSVKLVFKFLQKWNEQFFASHNIKLELLVIQMMDVQNTSQIITLIEMKQESKFDKFIKQIHSDINYKKVRDVKFGLFVFNTLQDPEDVNEAFVANTFSIEENTYMQEYEEPEQLSFDPKDLREQFLLKDKSNSVQQKMDLHIGDNFGEKDSRIPNKFAKYMAEFTRFMGYVRYQCFSHKYSILDKYTLIIMVCILMLLDNFMVQQICIVLFEFFYNSKWEDYQLLLFPYPISFIIAYILGSLWISTQSYGFLKMYLIFNSMTICVYMINLIPNLVKLIQQDGNCMFILLFTDTILKIFITQAGERLLSMNTKLNQLSSDTLKS